jgi:hypothetical protein
MNTQNKTKRFKLLSEDVLDLLRNEEKINHVPEDVLKIISANVFPYNVELNYIAYYFGKLYNINQGWFPVKLLEIIYVACDEFITENYKTVEDDYFKRIFLEDEDTYASNIRKLYLFLVSEISFDDWTKEEYEQSLFDDPPFDENDINELILDLFKFFYLEQN